MAHVSKVRMLQASARYVYAVCGEKKFQLVDGSHWQAKRGEGDRGGDGANANIINRDN